jgi:hypothetical protein
MTPDRAGQLYLNDLLLNPSVEAEDEERLSNQANKIYEQLLKGPMTKGENGNNVYEIVDVGE